MQYIIVAETGKNINFPHKYYSQSEHFYLSKLHDDNHPRLYNQTLLPAEYSLSSSRMKKHTILTVAPKGHLPGLVNVCMY
mmetsp:Transcript_16321/g.36721  ORF Transcript_16321/g.36721 Transcript_16321/m.36721 type:complete len:80 (+) Transcript_16321:93-332(+)